MDDKSIRERLRRQKIATIEQLMQWFKCSTITVRRRLKAWRSLTSINQNGRFYTLPEVPVFDANGLWRYHRVLFSTHGNLKKTILALITGSARGLSAVEIAQLVDLPSNSSFISRMAQVTGVKREKHQGRFIYFSDRPDIYTFQQRVRVGGRKGAGMPTDQEAVMILVELVKSPGIGIEPLAARVAQQGRPVAPEAIRAFLQQHDLVKKTADTRP
ncbi:MAG: hypothetical protein JRI36_09525 [Deltaproteobacteria bacterium]|nr:hypothetical protein [Deltaproteobacteria bacterium]